MRAQGSANTKPEVRLRQELHGRGLRFRLHRRVVPDTRRSVDITFGPARIAVFVDGCFWHGCPDHSPQSISYNADYWTQKIAGNRLRDIDTTHRLENAGWTVIRVWEHQDLAQAADHIAMAVRRRKDGDGGLPPGQS